MTILAALAVSTVVFAASTAGGASSIGPSYSADARVAARPCLRDRWPRLMHARGVARNLRISIADRTDLRNALLACLPRTVRPRGPLPRTLYYGRFAGYDWAIGTFWYRAVGSTDQPERFRRRTGTRLWHHSGDTGGPLYDFLPCPLLRAWRMRCG